MNYLQPTYHKSWQPLFATLGKALEKVDLALEKRQTDGEIVYPPVSSIFRAFETTALNEVKVVIVGQDPYHGEGEAQGLSFSVPDTCKRPPSLRNIFKEMVADLSLNEPTTNDLTPWANQGVLLINATLTVAKDCAASHKSIGWAPITDAIIRHISDQNEAVVFVLWGKFAEKKATLIDKTKHKIHISAHPSPLSAHRGFFGSAPFSTINNHLTSIDKTPIEWRLS